MYKLDGTYCSHEFLKKYDAQVSLLQVVVYLNHSPAGKFSKDLHLLFF